MATMKPTALTAREILDRLIQQKEDFMSQLSELKPAGTRDVKSAKPKS